MDGRGGCCIARYAGGAYDMSKVDRIMLRFRPIAPKPAVGGSVSGGSTPEKNDGSVKTVRTRRRYVRDNNKRCNRKRRVVSEERKDGLDETGVTLLPLLPETPDRKDSPARGSTSELDLKETTEKTTRVPHAPIWLNFSNPMMNLDRTVLMRQAVGSCMTVECVTEACVDEKGLGSTDEEKRKNLEWDTCPGFISDGLNRVEWTNVAYRRLVGQGEGEVWSSEMVWLVVKERLPLTCAAFACRVRLQYTCGKERNSSTVPCDVWRMGDGRFAWRLDVKAALSLGR